MPQAPARDKWEEFAESPAKGDKWDEFAEPGTANTGGATGSWEPITPTTQNRAQRRNIQAQPTVTPEARKASPGGKATLTGLKAIEAAAPFAIPAGEVAEAGSLRPLVPFARGAAKSVAGALAGKYGGGKVGELFGAAGKEAGELVGEVGGALAGPFASDEMIADIPVVGKFLYGEDELAAMKAAKLARQQAAEVKAGIRTPPPDPEYVRQKNITEAQEAAGKENVRRTAQASKAKEAALNKEANENMAIQKRYDDAQEARVQAEKEAKNARLKSEQAHEKNLKEAETARQKEITAQAKVRQIQEQMDAADKAKDAEQLDALKSQMKDAERDANQAATQKERLRTMHGDDLMRRGKEQAGLDKAAQDAAGEETAAKAELDKGGPAGGKGGPRPTSSEKYLTGLVKKNILSPDEFKALRTELGDDAVPRKGESNTAWRARVLGLIRSGRAARGMGDISSGASKGSAALTSRPGVTSTEGASGITFGTDSLGRYAEAPGVNRIYIPKSVPEGEVPQYAAQKLQEQARMTRSVKANQGNVAYRARPVGQAGIPSGSHAQATLDPEQAAKYAQDLANTTGQPHEVATIDLTKTPHTKVPHPSGATWVQFGDAHPEDVVVGKSKPIGPGNPGEFQF